MRRSPHWRADTDWPKVALVSALLAYCVAVWVAAALLALKYGG